METNLVEAKKGIRMVKVRSLGAIATKDGTVHPAGTVLELPEDEAKSFLKPIEGPYDFDGERSSNIATKAKITRAEVV